MIIQQYTRLVWYYRWCYWILFVMFIPKKHVRTNRIVIYEKDHVSFQWYRVVVVPSYYDVCEE